MVNRSASYYLDIGVLGEELVTEWLQSTEWLILNRRWHCRWGELDIIARQEARGVDTSATLRESEAVASLCSKSMLRKRASRQEARGNLLPTLAFIEVKTRSQGNWDVDGLLSITPQKQAKIWRTAECFLATHPDLADYPCRFDVALVRCQRLPKSKHLKSSKMFSKLFQVEQAGDILKYQLSLQEYIVSAFGY